MSRNILQTDRFKRQLRLAKKRGKDINKLFYVVKKLLNDDILDAKYRDHKLIGDFKSCRECHIQPDWLLVYRLTNDNIFELIETGSHADLFNL